MRRSSSRYWFARLRPLARPVFWAPAIAILLLILFAWEFLSRSELVSYFGISTPDENLSAEDQAIGADIDSLSLLMNDIRIAPRSEAIQTEILASPQQVKPVQAPTNQLFSSSKSITSVPLQTESTQNGFGVFRTATELGLTSAVATAEVSSPTPLPPNQLQAAMSKLAATESPLVAQTLIEGTARLEAPVNAAPRSTNSFSVLVEGAQPIQPGTPPPISVPLPIAPPINAPVPVVAPLPVELIAPQPVPRFDAVQPTGINQQPFTVPRSIPGRAIGGGNINTFSNP